MRTNCTAILVGRFPRTGRAVYRLSLGKIDEHRAETPHALMKKELHHAPHAGASMLSLSSRMPLWKWMIEDDPALITSLSTCMFKVYNADCAAFALDIATRPDIQERLLLQTHVGAAGIVTWLSKGRTSDKCVQRVVYHIDTLSRYRAAVIGATLDDPSDPGPCAPAVLPDVLRDAGADAAAAGGSGGSSGGGAGIGFGSAASASSSTMAPSCATSSTSASAATASATVEASSTAKQPMNHEPRRTAAWSHFRGKLVAAGKCFPLWLSLEKGNFRMDSLANRMHAAVWGS